MPGVSIVDTRNIIRAIRKKYHYDFSNYALTHFRYRIDEVLNRHHIVYPDILISRLLEDTEFIYEFLYDISIPQTEIFRDSEMWGLVLNDVLPLLKEQVGDHSIWLPDCTDSNDLTSIYFLLSKLGMTKKVKIFVSCLSNRMIRELKMGHVYQNHHSPEIAKENFRKLAGEKPSVSYENLINPGSDFRKSLFSKVIFFRQNTDFEPDPGNVDLIVFRNKLLNLAPEFQGHIFGKLSETLAEGGFIILGYKENIDDYLLKNRGMDIFNSNEKIYRKRSKP